MADNDVPRRSFLKTAGAAGTLRRNRARRRLAARRRSADAARNNLRPRLLPRRRPLLTLNADEAAFFSAAYDTIIPADPAVALGHRLRLVAYIDRQLAGAWGNGARLYRNGPFLPARPRAWLPAPADAARIFRRRH